jgi:nucleoside-diphosphate-sugar epimerase
MKRILITGVTGFVGTNLVRYFAPIEGVSLFGHSRDPESAASLLKSFPVTIIPDTDLVTLNQHGITTIIHTAGIAHDLSNTFSTEDYYKVNSGNTRILFDHFRMSAAEDFIFLSSIKAISDGAEVPLTEDMESTPSTDYGKSKREAEIYLLSQQCDVAKRIYILRPCMIHGPGNKGNLNLLYKYVKTGLPYPLAAFENQRSFLSIDNFTSMVGEVIRRDFPSGVYHLADTETLSTKELVRTIGAAMHRNVLLWRVPVFIIKFVFTLIGKKSMLRKLTETMVVSNQKIKAAMGRELPVTAQQGIMETIRSFDEK